MVSEGRRNWRSLIEKGRPTHPAYMQPSQQLRVGHVPTQACLLFAYSSEEVGVGAADNLTDML